MVGGVVPVFVIYKLSKIALTSFKLKGRVCTEDIIINLMRAVTEVNGLQPSELAWGKDL